MTKKHDVEVEEIKDRFCKVLCGGYNYGEKRCDCYPYETWGTAQAQCSRLNDTVDFAITRIGKAVLGNECPDLDKLLGVVGRCKAGLGEFSPMVTWAHGIWKEGLLTTEHETTTFIALREEKKR